MISMFFTVRTGEQKEAVSCLNDMHDVSEIFTKGGFYDIPPKNMAAI